MTTANVVAADTNLIKHPTTRRFLTAIEDLRGRKVVIVPTANFELRRHIPAETGDYIIRTCQRRNLEASQTALAVDAASAGAGDWWEAERTRNDSAYLILPEPDGDLQERYNSAAAFLPKSAFKDRNNNDRMIYAEAWVHDIDVLASRNFNSIRRKPIAERFADFGKSKPITIRTLYEHTEAIAEEENRKVDDLSVETMLAAILPEDWNTESPHDVRSSCISFIRYLREGDGIQLADSLKEGLSGLSMKEFLQLCENAYANRPMIARQTETRYHQNIRDSVRKHDIEFWQTPTA